MSSLLERLAISLAAVSALAAGQCGSLSTNLPNWVPVAGQMFDITAINPVTITSFDANLEPNGFSSCWSVSVYYVTSGGTMIGNENTPANWTLAGTTSVTSLGSGVMTPVPVAINRTIPAGATQGFYITSNGWAMGSPMRAAIGTAIGHIYVADANIRLAEGHVTASVANFGPVSQPWWSTPYVWSGRVNYVPLSIAGGWQSNQPEASLSLNGAGAGACPATTCVGATFTAALSSTLIGSGWDVAFHLGNAVTASGGGGVMLPNGNLLNVNLLSPTLSLLNGGTFPPFPGPLSIPLSLGAPIDLVAQMVVLDPFTPGGARLSAAVALHVAFAGFQPGPSIDNSGVTVNLGVPPMCGPASIPIYGVSYTQMHVMDNGRVMFSGPSGDVSPTPTVAGALAGQPFVGAWADLEGVGANISVYAAASDQVEVVYHSVAYHLSPVVRLSILINFNTTTGVIRISHVPLIGSVTANMFLGISKGAGATDPGPTVYSIGGPHPTTSPTDMIYNFGPASPALAPGVSTLTFTPSGGGYTWTGS